MANTPIEKYLEYLDSIFQVEPEFFREESLDKNLPGVTSIVYRDVPEKGMITALTYGVSRSEHKDWKFGRPELCITVESDDISWGQVIGYIGNQLRGEFNFGYGQTINFNEQISDESEMDAFLIFGPSILDKEDYLGIDVGLDYKINLAGLYPIYSSEIEKYSKIGLEEFWNHSNFDLYNVNRKRIE
ncbi:suppressor of fused domain protein [uncultured Pontibacter sp.]|uniref:suppressor of fused domain protein n=1 Tax=uncultured Pontibacter sp. TaxID=453356 RepID=UPI002604C1D8|nr:suppressor of fused domain protein [uncultured Pontibacter sp.]